MTKNSSIEPLQKLNSTIINSTKTFRPTTKNFQRQWYILDASKAPIGRIATAAAKILMGKNRADYMPDIDMGGCLIIINAEKVILTGQKRRWKTYFSYSGYPGGLKSKNFEEVLAKTPTKPIFLAIKNMLPKNKQQDVRMHTRLHIFVGQDHKITQNLILAN
jgi:large subunit ribosomal protein L13